MALNWKAAYSAVGLGYTYRVNINKNGGFDATILKHKKVLGICFDITIAVKSFRNLDDAKRFCEVFEG